MKGTSFRDQHCGAPFFERELQAYRRDGSFTSRSLDSLSGDEAGDAYSRIGRGKHCRSTGEGGRHDIKRWFRKTQCLVALLFVAAACRTVNEGSLIAKAVSPQSAAGISVVEFGDDGFSVEPMQAEATLTRLDALVDSQKAGPTPQLGKTDVRIRRPILVFAYTHGWHNNANPSDGDFQRFERLVTHLRAELRAQRDANLSRSRSGETVDDFAVFPIYLAWRGETYSQVPLSYTTFFSRKRAAERVGAAEYATLMRQLSKRRRAWSERTYSSRNMLILTAHSFGAGAMLTATLPSLAQRQIDANTADADTVAPNADLIVAINPAIEANVLNRSVLSVLARKSVRTIVKSKQAAPEIASHNALQSLPRKLDFQPTQTVM